MENDAEVTYYLDVDEDMKTYYMAIKSTEPMSEAEFLDAMDYFTINARREGKTFFATPENDSVIQ